MPKRFFHFSKIIVPFFIISLLLYLPAIINPKIILQRGNDLQEFFWPIYYFVKDNIVNNYQLPFWNNLILSGTPLLPDPQTPFFYFPNLIFLLLPINFAFILTIILHTGLAGLFFYLFLFQGLKFSFLPSLVGGILYLLSPKLAGYVEAGHIGLIYSWTWIPLVALSVIKLSQKPKTTWSILLAISLSSIFFTHILIFAICLISATVFYILLSPKKWRLFVLGLVLTFGLISVSLLSQLTWQKETTRYLLLTTRDVYPKWDSKKEFLSAVILPQAKETEKSITLGLFSSVLALLGLFKLKVKPKLLIIGLGLIITTISLNNASPLYSLMMKFDPYVLLRVATRMWFIVIIIATIMVSFWLEKTKNRLGYFIAILAVAESFFVSRLYLQKPIPPSTTAPQEVYEYLANDKDRFRVYCTTRCLSQKTSVIYNLELIDGYSTLIQKNYNSQAWQLTGAYWDYYSLSVPPIGAYTFEKLQPSAKSLGEYNTKYVISPHPLTDKNFQLIKKIDRFLIYQNQLFQPRFPVPVIKYTPNEIILDISNYHKPNITLAEVYNPDWKAYLDEVETPVQESPIHLRFIDLTSNSQLLVLKYKSKEFQTGKTVTFLTILLVIYLALGSNQNFKPAISKKAISLFHKIIEP